eukprot:Phypoly_transcript_05100.p1 GENE.Phypoly_transcript_05100~~Phypoly_transcript_05100.p1  ORF type:complete len:595 (+),score=127.31 Phypoly_transcript_05100:106-1890(+)
MGDAPLSFANDMWDGFDIICKRTDEGMDTCKHVLKFFSKRAEIEAEYSKALRNISSRYQSKIVETGELGNTFASIIEVTANYADTFHKMHEGIMSNVVFHVTALIKDLETKRKTLISEGQKLRAGLQEKSDAMKKAQLKYEKLVREAKQNTERSEKQAQTEISEQAERANQLKMEKKLEEAATAEDEYKVAILENNDYQGSYYREKMPRLLSDFQHYELTRIRLLKSNLQKFTSLTSELPPHLLEPLPALRESITKLDGPKEVQRFIRENKSPKPPAFEAFKFEPCSDGRLIRTGVVGGKVTLAVKPLTAVYGVSLEDLMANQAKQYPDLEIPKIQAYLQDIILQLDGPVAEGIFRVSVNVTENQAYKKQLDQGIYQLVVNGNPDMRLHAASLLKMWLRELPGPLIPTYLYDACVQDPHDPLVILPRMPSLNRAVLTRLIHFLQIFVQPENAEKSKMGLSNMAIIFTPILLRCPSEELALLNINQQQEFVKSLITKFPDLSKSVYSKYIISSQSPEPSRAAQSSPTNQPAAANRKVIGTWQSTKTLRTRGGKTEWAQASPSQVTAASSLSPPNTPLVTLSSSAPPGEITPDTEL